MSTVLPVPSRRILVIDDNASIHADFRKILTGTVEPGGGATRSNAIPGTAATPAISRPSFQVETALQAHDGIRQAVAARAAGLPFQVAFVDMRMAPGWSGLQTIETLWAVDETIQTVICTTHAGEQLDDWAQRRGNGHRLLVVKKPLDPVEVRRLATALCEQWTAEAASRHRVQELDRVVAERTAQIEHAAAHDPLTGLPNRAQGLLRVEACIQRSRRRPQHFAVLVVDVDRFERVNTTIGHAAGDQILLEAVTRLRDCLRSAEALGAAVTASRLDGVRFMILLEDLRETSDSARIAQRVLDRLAEPFSSGGQDIFIDNSIGIATSDHEYERADDMLRDADSARGRAVAAGGGIYAMFDGAAQAAVKRRLAMESALRAAIRDELIEVQYQPVVRIPDGHLLGFEALVRWNDPELGQVSPADLIAVAEDTPIIHALGALVFRIACRQQREWHDTLGSGVSGVVSVNLSPKQLAHPGLLQRLTGIMRDTRVRPEWMSLEITESALMADPDAAAVTLARLRDTGLTLQLDDFGTGYSSLSRLHRLPLDGLKVDRSFVQDICTRREHVQVLEAITSIARAFRMNVTVEGIETPEQLEIVRRLNIDRAQGYLFGKPMPPQDATRLMRRRATAGVQ